MKDTIGYNKPKAKAQRRKNLFDACVEVLMKTSGFNQSKAERCAERFVDLKERVEGI